MTITETIARAMEAESDFLRDSIASETLARCVAALTEAGFAIVPREPTEAMLGEGAMQAGYCTSDFTAASACLPGHVYRAMINATPDHIMPAIQTAGPLDSEKGE